MANVGTAPTGKTLISQGNAVSPTFADIGTDSGLTANTLVLAQGTSPFTTVGPFGNGQIPVGVTGSDPLVGAIVSPDSSITVGYVSPNITLTVTGGSTVGKTITGDSGGALSPSSGNWNILGLSGSKTSGSGSTLTVKSPPYADSTAATLTINSGTFATASGTYTLPASPADGDLVEIVCITTGIVVTANTGQEIQLAGDVTSTGGTATNSAKGDVLVLRYRSTDTAWYATSSMGVWVLA